MPELPEVETIVRTLRPHLVGATLDDVWTSGKPLRLARPVETRRLARLCRGARVADVRRRGKYILVDLDRGGVLVHLGMSGRLRLQDCGDARDKHTHVVWTVGARELRFVDPRRFGLVRASQTIDAWPELALLGPDPLLDLDEAMLAAALAGSRAPIKAFLLDQRRLAGMGNIYVSEALFRARIHPTMQARRVVRRAAALVAGIREALEMGIANRGTTLRDYVDGEGGAGQNQHLLLVYGRDGQPCRTCGLAIKRRVDAMRSTFFCAGCQKR